MVTLTTCAMDAEDMIKAVKEVTKLAKIKPAMKTSVNNANRLA